MAQQRQKDARDAQQRQHFLITLAQQRPELAQACKEGRATPAQVEEVRQTCNAIWVLCPGNRRAGSYAEV